MQTDAACEVEILGARERTWCVDGLHFALVAVEGLAPGADHPYEVRLDGEVAWPQDGTPFPPSTIRLLDPRARHDVVFGSCRITLPHEPPYIAAGRTSIPPGTASTRCAPTRCARPGDGGGAACPDLLLMLGDQVYADEPSPALEQAIAGRERPADAPAGELADFAEYALAYREAWSEPAIRWLLSTVPTTMVFDDHEIHAEWRISQGWLDEMNAEPWFDAHIRAGLMAYWVFQHLGNLSPGDLAEGGLYDAVRAADDAGGLLASRMDTEGRQVGHSRWSFARDVGDARLVVIDSRAGRDVTPGRRELVQDEEWEWIREQARRPARHLLLASSVPFLLAPGPAPRRGVRRGADRRRVGAGRRLAGRAAAARWRSWTTGRPSSARFRRFAELVDDVAHGREGEAPASIVMLSGDVHHCYLARGRLPPRRAGAHAPVWQAVCSAFRKELAPHERAVIALGHARVAGRLARRPGAGGRRAAGAVRLARRGPPRLRQPDRHAHARRRPLTPPGRGRRGRRLAGPAAPDGVRARADVPG